MDILTLLKANLKHKKGSFISILVLMLIISTVLTSVLSIQRNMNTRVNDAHKAIDTGDIVVYMQHDDLTDEMLNKVKSCDYVSKVATVPSMMMRDVLVNGQKGPANTFLRYFKDNNYNYPLFNETETDFVKESVPLQENEILLPISMKTTYSCKRGDAVVFNIGTEKIHLVIGGFIEEPFSGANVMNIKQLIVSEATYKHIHDVSHIEEHPDNLYIWNGEMVHIYQDSAYTGSVYDFSKDVNKASNIISLGFTSITTEQTISYTLLITNIVCGVLEAFVILLLIVVVLVLSNNINSSIEMDYTNIGILKSQGFTKLQIRLVLLMQYLLSGFLGSFLGILLSIPLVQMLRNMFTSTSGLLFSNRICIFLSAGILLSILLLLGVFILYKTRKIAKISPVNAIAGGLNDVYFKNLIQTPVIGKSKSFLNLKLAFRQLTTNVKWYLGTCFILALLSAFVCMTASFSETFTEQYYKELFGIKVSDIRVNFEDGNEMKSEVEATLSSVSPIKESFHYDFYYLLMDQEQIEAQVLSDTSYLTSILEGRAPKYDNEIVITNLISKRLGKKVGDTVELQVKANKKEYLITGIYDSCSDIGRCFSITLDGIRRVAPDYEIDCWDYFLEDSGKVNEAMKVINEKYADAYKITAKEPSIMDQKTIDAIMSTSNLVMLRIIAISFVFAIIVICLISNKMYLRERQMLGIYKAFGFTSTNIRFQYCFRFLLVTLLGCTFGGVVFIFFGNTLNASVMTLAGISSYDAPVTFFNLGLPILLICVTVFIASFITMRKVKKIDAKSLISE